MADFSPAFAHANGDKRMPTSGEIEDGFGCGPLSLPLFNGLFNAFYAELGALMTLNGLTPSNANMQQVAEAVQAGKLNFAVATGAANAWVVDPVLAVPAYAAGRVLWIKAPATNTATAVTVNVSGLGTRPVKKADGSNPAVGDLVSGRWYATIDDGTNVCVVGPLPSDSLGKNGQVFSASGTFNVPAGVVRIKARVWGAGGGGGGCTVNGGAAGGGGGGGYAEGWYAVTPGGSVAITVGVGGAGGAAGQNNGLSGGASSVASLVSATGGAGGGGANNTFPSGGLGGTGTSGAYNRTGQQGSTGYLFGGSTVGNGVGGGTHGVSNNILQTGGIGGSGQTPAGGGNGAAGGFGAQAGGAGADGLVIVEW